MYLVVAKVWFKMKYLSLIYLLIGVGKWDSEWKSNKKNKKFIKNFFFVLIFFERAGEDNFTPEDNVQHMNWKKSMKNLEKMKNPMYKAGTSYQNQRLFSSTSTKSFSTYK